MDLELAGIIFTISLAVASVFCAVSFAVYVIYYVIKDHRHSIYRTFHL